MINNQDWYYVESGQRVGPVGEKMLCQLIRDGHLNNDSYVWKSGFTDWIKLSEVVGLDIQINPPTPVNTELPKQEDPPAKSEMNARPVPSSVINWDSITNEDQIFTVKIGDDRGGVDSEYGPFTLVVLKQLYQQHRINEKTLVFTPGMDNWIYLADMPLVEQMTGGSLPPVISESERRDSIRRPFVARLFLHDNTVVTEGICRDISIGGMQLLVSNSPFKVNDCISFNVHPDNSDFHFVADGKIVRLLEGNQGFSLRFIKLGPQAQETINRYLADS
ncbi:MAG: DUF4339 domain-containing protein [Bdellovibrionales bacterium]|jgi:hypothetical protein|nr:DUF4339 domain-containing protein [Bdellovibrionales bacterium]MBT3525842.1 DUF4339 domain-containing protein [Bdellovibrionales bacterium]MBT7670288.1 DUF4339 domain-containing protein [Bdellovibrionales bacterium]MBT7765667.1 DUF4339 domain-containing protein [Bdellovibrionales bacterium]